MENIHFLQDEILKYKDLLTSKAENLIKAKVLKSELKNSLFSALLNAMKSKNYDLNEDDITSSNELVIKGEVVIDNEKKQLLLQNLDQIVQYLKLELNELFEHVKITINSRNLETKNDYGYLVFCINFTMNA